MLFGRHRWYDTIDTIEEFHVISLRCYRSAVWLFLCLSRSEGIDTISFAYNSPMCLPAVYVKICQPPSSSPTFAAKWFKPCPVGMSVGVTRRQIAAEWLELAQWSQWITNWEQPSLFRMVPYDIPFPKWVSQTQHKIRNARCHLANVMEDIDKRCRLLPNGSCFRL